MRRALNHLSPLIWTPQKAAPLWVPKSPDPGPYCSVCKDDEGHAKPVDVVDTRPQGDKRTDVFVQCHGAEDWEPIHWDSSGFSNEELMDRVSNMRFFRERTENDTKVIGK